MSRWHLRRQRADVLAPVLLKVVGCTEVVIRDIQLLNSPFYHLVAVHTRRLTLSGLFIHAPLDSKNTDGISLINSSDVTVRGCTVDTGDDNCAVKEGCRNVLVEDCDFRNGHGSSIGSIGEGGSYGEVQDVTMRNIVFNATVNAARVKTWQGGAVRWAPLSVAAGLSSWCSGRLLATRPFRTRPEQLSTPEPS
jgi:polygalacturonase